MQINKDMLIGQLVQMDELIPQMLMGAGMHCLGCPSSQMETIEEAAMVHGISPDELVSQINDFLANNYIWFLVISIILCLSLIGYLVDMKEQT